MADIFEDKRQKLKALQAKCAHGSHLVFDTGEWYFEICENCGLQQNVSHQCKMSWNEEETALTCPVCGTDGT